MEGIVFTIYYNNKTHIKEINTDITFMGIKNELIKEYMPDGTKYIDLTYMGKNPIRKFGGYTIEPGIVHRGLDNKNISQFNFNNKNLHFSVNIDNNYSTKFIPIKKNINNKKPYIAPYKRYNTDTNNDIQEYEYSADDFPALGSNS